MSGRSLALKRARLRLRALADGVDPDRGVLLTPGDVLQHPETVRALFHAIDCLASSIRASARTPKVDVKVQTPVNAARDWDVFEDRRLICHVADGLSYREIARRHQRSPGAVRRRAVTLGLKSPRPRLDAGH
ncbi:MAG: hypothetical protein AAFY64_05150 [Pseudomonadota bacterium]